MDNKGTIGNSIRTKDFRYTEWWVGDEPIRAVATNLAENPGETTAVEDPEILGKLSEQLRERVLEARK